MPASLHGQRVQLQDFFGNGQPNSGLPVPPAQLPSLPQNVPSLPAGFAPQNGLIPNGFVQPTLPQFDGFSPGTLQVPQIVAPSNFGQIQVPNPALTPTPSFPSFPRVTNPFPAPGTIQANPGFRNPGIAPQANFGFQAPRFQAPNLAPQTFTPPTFNQQPFQPVAPIRWPYEGTGSNWLPSIDFTPVKQAWDSFQNQFLPRLLERPRARYTYIVGDNDNQLNINDVEFATTLVRPNFLRSNQPLRISPGFNALWLDGPNSNVSPGFDLPGQLYSAYLAFDHTTNPASNRGLETNATIGYYSDFDNNDSDGIRLTGRLVGWRRLNEYTIGKLGVEYFDRIDVKLLPAFGVYMAPNPNIRWDLFFPRSKLAHRLPNLSNFEVWGFVAAEYGGGSWVIDRADGSGDQADINDVRATMGLEWMGPRRVAGFAEIGYVFEREIVYRSRPNAGLDLEDAFIFRSGLAF